MKILVIGGTGLISSEVVRQLVEHGDALTVFNRGQTPKRMSADVAVLLGDRKSHADFESSVQSHGPWDIVIDMICHDPDDARSLVRACRRDVGQVVFCSTSNVYPKPATHYPVREDHPLSAAFQNGIDKIECETICREAAVDFALTVVRPGHTYGETGVVLHSLGSSTSYLDRIRCGRPIIVHGDGNGLWSALHAADVASLIVAATGNPRAYGRTYNATSEEWMTWNQYQEKVAAALDVAPAPVTHIPTDVLARLAPDRAAQCQRSLQYPGIYDSSRARQELGWQPRISFIDGMRRVVTWLEEHGAIESWQSDPGYDCVLEAFCGATAHFQSDTVGGGLIGSGR